MKNLFLILFTILIINDTYTQEADLIIENITTETNSALGGSQFYFSYDLKNQGDGTANSSRVKYYLSDDIIFDDEDIYKGKTLIDDDIPASESNDIEASVYLSISMTEGEYYILIIADGNYEVSESDEENNINYFSFEIMPDNPDLLIPNISVFNTTDTVNIGSELNLFYQFANWGTENASASHTNFFLSEDSIFSNDDISMAILQNTEIEALTSIQIYQYLNIPTNIPEGIYYILAIVDFENIIIENNEENNMNFVEIFVHIPVCDLLVNNLNIENSNVFVGSDINFSFEVENTGDLSSSETNMIYYLSEDNNVSFEDIVLSNENLGIVNAESSLEFNNNNFNISDAISAGDYYLIISLDPIQFVEETNETNNTSSVLISINPTEPDLLIQNVTTNNDTININENILLNLEIINQGSENITNASEIHYFLSDNLIYDDEDFSFEISTDCNPLNSTEIQNIENVELTMPDTTEGIYYLILINDFLAEIDGENNENNIQFYQIYINKPKSDLVIQNLEILYNTNFLPADEIHFSFNIKNIGFVNSEITNLKYFLSGDNIYDDNDILINSLEIPVINSNDSISSIDQFFTTTEVINSGVHYLIFVLDKENSLEEENENNNIDFVEFYIIPTEPDLLIQNVSTNNNTVNINENILINYEIVNEGLTNVENFTTSIYLSEDENLEEDLDIILLSHETDILNAQDTSFYNDIEITVPNGTTEGNYYIILKTDNENVITEIDEENNINFVEIFVNIPVCDLTVNNFILENSDIFIGSDINFSFEVQNNGDLSSSETNMVYYLSEDNNISSEDIILSNENLAIVNGESSLEFNNNFNISDAISAGDYYLIISIDPIQFVQEANETNNIFSVLISINTTEPDLLIQNLSTNNNTVNINENILINYEIVNQGNTNAENFTTSIYLSEDENLEENLDIILLSQETDILNEQDTSFYNDIEITIPNGTVEGDYYIILKTDNENIIIESDEENNLSFYEIFVNEPKADLNIENFILNNEEYFLGEEINFSFEIQNLGDLESGTTNFVYCLSQDSLFDDEDLILNDFALQVIYENDYIFLENETINIPEIDTGYYYLLIVLDENENVTEENENNNSAFYQIHIGEFFSDLIIENVNLEDEVFYNGSNFNLFCDLKNIGDIVSDTTYLKMYISENNIFDENDDILLNTVFVDTLQKDSTLSYEINSNIPEINAGNYYLLLVVDNDNFVVEENESNNLYFISISVSILETTKDLTLSNFFLESSNVSLGEYANVNYTIENLGNGLATSNLLAFYLSEDNEFGNSDIPMGSVTIENLYAFGEEEGEINLMIPSFINIGDWKIIAIVDVNDQVEETNEENNSEYLDIFINEIDLKIINAIVTPTDLSAGQTIHIDCELKNDGNTNSGNTNLKYYFSENTSLDENDLLIHQENIDNLEAGEVLGMNIVDFDIPETTLNNDYFILLIVDNENEISESNENNNFLSLEFTVLDETSQIPNLIFNSYSLFPNEINIGGEININFEVANYGIGASPVSDIKFYLSDDFVLENESDILLGETSINSLDANEVFDGEINFIMPLDLDSGVWFIIAVIDTENQILESNESDNMFFASFHLSTTALSDLEIQNFYFTYSGEEIYSNEKIEIFCDIKNIGDTISENSLLIYYLSKDSILDISEDIEVAADLVSKLNNDSISKENTEIAIPYIDEESDWYIILFADANEEIRELNEENNISFEKIHIFPPDAMENINSKFNFSIYPNPSSSYFYIELEKQNFEKINLEIYDAFGRKIISEKIIENSYKKEFDISNFQKGVYLIKIGNTLKKLIVN